MPKNIGVAEVKKHFSEIMNGVSRDGKHFVIERKGKPVAAMVSVKELELIERKGMQGDKKGLLAAIGVWEDFEGLDRVVDDIYRKRRKAKKRRINGLI